MPSINVKFPELPRVNNNFTYADIHLDLELDQLVTNEVNKVSQVSDVKADYDVGAIRNGIINFFTTIPGDKVLNPEFGIDLRQFLFYPLSETVAFSISQQIRYNITTFDSRLTITALEVIPMYDNLEYIINISLQIPSLSSDTLDLKLNLNSSGYVTL